VLSLALLAFVLTVLYAVVGNTMVLLILIRRKAPLRFMWSGTPFYLYGMCNRLSPPSPALKAFALSTNIALIVAVPLLIWTWIAGE
jgi:hypothetical protein